MQHRPEIDGLRAVAVLPVVLYHAGVSAFSGGYVGVDVFFVVSGFLITGLIKEDLEAGRFSILGFYNRRIRRILPALVFTTLATSIAAFMLLLPSFLIDFSKSLVSVALFASNFYFWQASGYFDASAHLRPMLHTWSLAVEEQFYIFMPIAAYFVYRFLGRRWLLIFGVAALASFALSVFATYVGPTANFFLLPTRAWELLLGSLLAIAPLRSSGGALPQAASALGMALIAWAVFTYNPATPFPGAAALAPCIGAALILAFAHPTQTWVGRLLTLKPMIWIGLISYSLYLLHWPIVVFWRYLTLEEPDLFDASVITAASIALAAFSWRFVEQPFRRRGGTSNLRVIAAGLAALTLIGAIGALGWIGQGFPNRPGMRDARAELTQAPRAEWRHHTCFLENEINVERWSAQACTINPQGSIPTLLWGDSFAAQYVPGLMDAAPGQAARIYQYTAAGCPPVLSYYSYARPNCRRFNENALRIIDDLGIERVIVVARWQDLRMRGLDQLRSTLEALRARNLDVIVIGQSPMFITDVFAIAARRPEAMAWRNVAAPTLNAELRAVVAGDALFIDPTSHLCTGELCPFRDETDFLYWDYGHFSAHGSGVAVRAYMSLGE